MEKNLVFAHRLENVLIERGYARKNGKPNQYKYSKHIENEYGWNSKSFQAKLSKWLAGVQEPTVSSLEMLGEDLQVSSDYLLGLSDRKESYDIQYIQDYTGLSEESIRKLKHLNDGLPSSKIYACNRVLENPFASDLLEYLGLLFTYNIRKNDVRLLEPSSNDSSRMTPYNVPYSVAMSHCKDFIRMYLDDILKLQTVENKRHEFDGYEISLEMNESIENDVNKLRYWNDHYKKEKQSQNTKKKSQK